MYPSNFRKNFRLLVCAPANQQTKWRQMTADLTDNSRCIEGSHLTSQVQGSQHAAMLGGKLSVVGGLGTFTHMFVLCNFAQL